MAASTAPAAPPATLKQIHSLVLDTGPLIKNDPPASVLLAKAEQLYTLPIIISEIRDPATRSRVETTLLPFVELRSPRPASIQFVTAFARKTGDLGVLSKPDLQVLALGYELECERNGGDWRLRATPGQARVNGRPPQAEGAGEPATQEAAESQPGTTETEAEMDHTGHEEGESLDQGLENLQLESTGKEEQREEPEAQLETGAEAHVEAHTKEQVAEDLDVQAEQHVADPVAQTPDTLLDGEKADETTAAEEDADDSDDGGWITPSNLKKHQAKNSGAALPEEPVQKTLQAAVLTSDFAMQNVALRMNLNLLAPSLARITHLRSWVLRCHGCFTITRDMDRQFCPSCGQPTLIRTSCSTDAQGRFAVHLKRNYQWNKRGNVYSVPKPAHGSPHGRVPKNQAGKGGWGAGLVLAEDQKEYLRAGDEQRRARRKDIMDDDYMPDLLSGARTSAGAGGKIRVGAGRNVNSKRKH